MKDNCLPIDRLKETTRQPIVAVIGGRLCDEEIRQFAYLVGKGIAERGAILLCGGKSGVMEAACHGAYDAGGLTMGILTGEDDSEANSFVKIVIPTGIGVARNSIIIRTCDAAIAVGGKYGTLSEIAYCLEFEKPVCSLKSWEIDSVVQVKTPEDALDFVFANIAKPSKLTGDK
ncbi:MAG: TIGR00725 family protein [Candidatus Marinimicrobia bacterium]|nr:TIGR00725 family protein [Candidatus Neomarinimicrobiota bacterium]